MGTHTIIASIALLGCLAQSQNAVALVSDGDRATLVRRELVGPGFGPVTGGEIILMREVRRTADGYVVKVKAADGTLRMRGTYADEALTVANGLFSYYHDNGRLESQGMIVNGTKSGTWVRFDREGQALNEKIYDGKNYDQRTAEHGWNAPVN